MFFLSVLNCCSFPSVVLSIFLCLFCLSFDWLSLLVLLAYFVVCSFVLSFLRYLFNSFRLSLSEVLSFFLCFCLLFFLTFDLSCLCYLLIFASFDLCFFSFSFLDFAWSIFFGYLGQVSILCVVPLPFAFYSAYRILNFVLFNPYPFAPSWLFVYLCACMHETISMSGCMYVCMHACMHACMCLCAYTCTYVRLYICTHVHT